jgi:mannose-6-phosphate isomerase-like protein (cupin superfamily)
VSERPDAGEPRLVRAADAPRTQLRYGRGTVLRLVDAAIGARAVDMHLNTIRAGSAPGPYHLHTRCENVYYVLSGLVRIRIDGVDHDASPGDAVFIPPGVPHSATNAGADDARLLEIYAPAEVDFVEVPDSPGDT